MAPSKILFLCRSEDPLQEANGLDPQVEVHENQPKDNKVFSLIKMLGLRPASTVTLRKGICINDAKFWVWVNEINLYTIKRQEVIIRLIDQTGTSHMTWIFKNAWPTKISGTDLKSEGNEVAVETLEIAYEELTISSLEK